MTPEEVYGWLTHLSEEPVTPEEVYGWLTDLPEEPVTPEEVYGGVEFVRSQEVGHSLVVLTLLLQLLGILLAQCQPRLVRGCNSNTAQRY